MTELTSVDVGFGSVTFTQLKPEIPTTTEEHGDTTINYMGTPGKEAFFEASYLLTCRFQHADDEYSNILSWSVRLPAGDALKVPYSEVEAEGARQIAPMLRAVADAVEKRVQEFDESLRGEDQPPADR